MTVLVLIFLCFFPPLFTSMHNLADQMSIIACNLCPLNKGPHFNRIIT
jgi:Na+-transporting NADH:ubiquinone oxidoreductase subunit NqrB